MYDEAFWINFYQLRFFEEITKDIMACCPDAWHLMVANPVVAGTTLLQRKYPQVKMVGLCHGYAMSHWIAAELGYDKNDITYQMPGVNHFVWMNEARLKGEPLFPILEKWIEEKSEDFWKTCGKDCSLSKKRVDFYKKHGVIGIGDTLGWTGASWPWWYHSDDEVDAKFNAYPVQVGWDGYFSMVKKNAADIIALSKDKDAPISSFLDRVSHDDLMVPLVEAIAGDIPRVLIINTLNKGHLAAKTAIDEAIRMLGSAVIAAVNLLSPDRILFSGGLAQQQELYLLPLIDYVKTHCYSAGTLPFMGPAALGENAPLIGAALAPLIP